MKPVATVVTNIITGTLCTCNETRCNSPDKGENFTKEAETAAAVSLFYDHLDVDDLGGDDHLDGFGDDHGVSCV